MAGQDSERRGCPQDQVYQENLLGLRQASLDPGLGHSVSSHRDLVGRRTNYPWEVSSAPLGTAEEEAAAVELVLVPREAPACHAFARGQSI